MGTLLFSRVMYSRVMDRGRRSRFMDRHPYLGFMDSHPYLGFMDSHPMDTDLYLRFMATLRYLRLLESYGRHGTKVRISEAIEKTNATVQWLAWMPPPYDRSEKQIRLILAAIEKILAARNVFRNLLIHSLFTKEKEYLCFDDVSLILEGLAIAKEVLFSFFNAFNERNPSRWMALIKLWRDSRLGSCATRKEWQAEKRREREANKRRSTLEQIEFVEAKKNTAFSCYAVAMQMHTAPAPGAPRDDGNCVPPSTQMPMALPSNDPSSVGASIDADPNHIENPGDEPSSSTEASPAQAPDITTSSSSNGACDDGNRTQPSKQMVGALSSNDPASVGASIDDDPNHIEKPGDEPSSSMEAPPALAPDITSSSNGACDNGNLAPPSTQMPMALPSDEPVSVGASIDDPNHIDNPGDEPSSSTEASRAHVPDITSSSNGACDDGNPAPPSTQMPVALPSNDPAPVGGSSDDDPNGIGNPSDESSRSTEASPAHPPDITPSSNGASPPVREDDSERREPPAPRDIENQRDGNGDLEAIPKQVLLTFALQAFQILSNVKSNDNSLLSRKAEILQYCAEALTVIGFFCGLGVILLRNHRNQRAATDIMSTIGFYVTGLGFIATLCVPLGKFMFWILGFIGFLFSALYTYALWEGWIV